MKPLIGTDLHVYLRERLREQQWREWFWWGVLSGSLVLLFIVMLW